jgi:hypothetical protein
VPLPAWETFYVIVGSSAAALTGLMFVVIALMADGQLPFKTSEGQLQAFGTPTVVHFSAVLLQSAILTAPWPSMTGVRVTLGAYGLAGLVYTLIVVRRTLRQTGYTPVLEDWMFHAVLPLVAYTVISFGTLVWPSHPEMMMFAIGGAAVLLLFVGIHNAWDTVTFLVISRLEQEHRNDDAKTS